MDGASGLVRRRFEKDAGVRLRGKWSCEAGWGDSGNGGLAGRASGDGGLRGLGDCECFFGRAHVQGQGFQREKLNCADRNNDTIYHHAKVNYY